MKQSHNRKFLLSVRERPLPVLWLLVLLAPYLFLSLASVPHFHSAELSAGHSQSFKTFGSESSTQAQAQQAPAAHEAAECLRCDWSAGTNGHILFTLHNVSFAPLLTEYSSPAFPLIGKRVFSFDNRGPPVS